MCYQNIGPFCHPARGLFFSKKMCYNSNVNIIHFSPARSDLMKRKIMKATGNVLLDGDSLVDGISIRYASKGENGELEYVPGRSTARINANGEIYYTMEKKIISNETDTLIERVEKVASKLKIVFKIIIWVMFVMIFVSAFFASTMGIRLSLSICCLGVALKSFAINLAWFVLRLKKDEDAISLMKFHSAEHAVINAYYDLKRIPEYKELRFYSNYSNNCGTLRFAPKLTVFLGFALIHLFLPWIWLIPGHIVVLLICMLLHKENKLYFLESLVLIQPTSKEYRVALAALGTELERAVMFEEDVDDICC